LISFTQDGERKDSSEEAEMSMVG